MGKQFQAMGPPPEAVGSAAAQAETWETTVSAVGTSPACRASPSATRCPGSSAASASSRGRSPRRARSSSSSTRTSSGRSSRRRDARTRPRERGTSERSRTLAAGNVIGKAQLDDIEAQLKTATADAEALRAQIERKVVRAPFTGRLGIRAVNLGQYLNPGTHDHDRSTRSTARSSTSRCRRQSSRASRSGMPVRVTIEGAKERARRARSRAIDPTVDADDAQRQAPRARSRTSRRSCAPACS